MRLLGAIAVAALLLSGQTAVAAPAPVEPDPLLAFLADPGQADLAGAARAREARTRARVLSAKPGYTYAEREPASVRGRNDSPWLAESTDFKRHRSALFTGSLTMGDKDFFAIDLKAGDVIGASVTGAARKVVVHDTRGREVMGSRQDYSGVYPKESPLPGGGNAVADHVAPRDGRYVVGVEDGDGRYELTVKAFRPGSEKAGLQTVFVDFNGALVDTSVWGSPGEKQLSPLAKFLAAWGLSAGDERAVVSAAVDTIRENLALHGKFGVRLLNSRDHADPWGQRNVSRLVIGGTIAESGVETVAIAQSIDPGNFGHEETAMVQLDLLSQPAGPSVSLNTYIGPASDKVRFVGRALGNIASHELGHLSGSWHQHQFNAHDTLMDQGGNPKAMFAVGADGIGGNADDTDMDFGEDEFVPNEGFTGVEDAASRTRWGYSRG